jgi:hypothetical protein
LRYNISEQMFLITTSPTIIFEIIIGLRSYLIVLISTYYPKSISRTTMPLFRSHLPKVVKNGKPVFSPKTGPRHRKAKLYRYKKQTTLLYYCMLYSTCKMCKLYSNSLNTENVKTVLLFKELMDVKICRKLTKNDFQQRNLNFTVKNLSIFGHGIKMKI